MTYIVAITCDEGVIFASDKQSIRNTDGNATKETVQKIISFDENRLWACAGDELCVCFFVSFVCELTKQDKPLTNSDLTCQFDKFIKNTREKLTELPIGYSFEYLIVGHNKTPQIWYIPREGPTAPFYEPSLFAGPYKNNIFCAGVGTTVPRTFFNRLKTTFGNYNLDQGSLIAYRMVMEAINSTEGVGLPVDIWTIQNDNVVHKSKGEITELRELYNEWMASEQLMAKVILAPLG